jgi:hypothetical protein
MDRLGKLAAVMDQCGNRSFVDIYVQNRAQCLEETLARKQDIVAEDINPEAQMYVPVSTLPS